MSTAADTRRERRFACTQCGACCDRSPEVELSEAAALADAFVFRLMFRLYRLPRTPAGGSSAAFYERKRLLAAFAARKYPVKTRQDGKTVEHVNYLTLSALTLDTGTGACAALSGGRCTLYERRPLACRALPFHYSRPEASAESELETFVATPGYACDTGAGAPVVLESGRIVAPQARQARGEALALAERDRPWKQAILRRLRTDSRNQGLPSLREIEANAPFGATTTSMRVAWWIAVEAGVMDAETCRALIETQAALIDRALAAAKGTPGTLETLDEMRAEHRQLLLV
jgi:Fe-S-cluster containining protein